MYEILSGIRKICALSALTLLFTVNSFSQSSRIDSLLTLSRSTENDSDRYGIVNGLVQEYFKSRDYNAALEYAFEGKAIALRLGDSSRVVKCGRNLGIILNRLERFEAASGELLKVLPIAKRLGLKEEYKSILNNLGLSYTFQANYDEALKFHFENLQLLEKGREMEGLVDTYNNIGLIYFKLKNPIQALDYYQKALALNDQIPVREIERLFINIGLCYNLMGDFAKAEEFFLDAMESCGGGCTPDVLLEGNFGLAQSSFFLKKYDVAKGLYEESLRLSRDNNNKRFEAENLLQLSRIDVLFKNYESAIHSLLQCKSLAINENYSEILIEVYKELSKVYNQTGDFQRASGFQNEYIHLKDSIYNEKLLDNLAKVQTEYAERENIKTIATKDVVIEQQRDLNIAVAVIAILAGLLILVLQRSNRVSKQVNAQLSEAKETIQQQNKLLEIKNKDLDREVEKKTIDLERVNLSLKQVNDELDNFIYKTSHDIRGPLASLKGMCNVALMDVKDPVALDYLRKLDATAERLNSILTRLLIINQINNSKLMVAHIDFAKTIDDILKLENKKGVPSKIAIRKNIATGPEMSILSDKELVRIVLENLIDNAIKFFNESPDVESFVEIVIAPMENGDVRARVIDNGIGISESNPGKLFQMFFRASERSEIGGIGLYIVKTATTKVGGKVGLLTTPEGYTEFNVVFPKNPPTADDYPAATYKK